MSFANYLCKYLIIKVIKQIIMDLFIKILKFKLNLLVIVQYAKGE